MKDKISLAFLLGFGSFGVYVVLIAIIHPERFLRYGRYYTGLNGWEFGGLLLGIYLFIAYLFLAKNPRLDTLTLQSDPNTTQRNSLSLRFRTLVVLNVLVSIAIFLFMFVTQVLEVLIKMYKGYPRENGGTTGFGVLESLFYSNDYEWTLNMIWTFCGVFFLAIFICLGLSVDLANRQHLFGFTKVSP
jgi:preprotein translocase subunit SecG